MTPEEKIKTENDTFALKREYKYALENLSNVKKELSDAISLKETVAEQIEKSQEELTSVKNQISQEKLDWASHRHSELQEIENKRSEAENVLKRKAELNEQEEKIRQDIEKNTQVLNENRRLELVLKEKEQELVVKAKEIEKEKTTVVTEAKTNKENMAKFKESIIKLIKSVENI